MARCGAIRKHRCTSEKTASKSTASQPLAARQFISLSTSRVGVVTTAADEKGPRNSLFPSAGEFNRGSLRWGRLDKASEGFAAADK